MAEIFSVQGRLEMTDAQFEMLQKLFHNWNEVFYTLPEDILEQYFEKNQEYHRRPPVTRPCKSPD